MTDFATLERLNSLFNDFMPLVALKNVYYHINIAGHVQHNSEIV